MPLILAASFASPQVAPQANAPLVGQVCVAPLNANPLRPCTLPAPTFTGPVTTPPTQIRIGVWVNNSDTLNGFDITLKTDHTILKPADADLTGSIVMNSPLSSPFVLSKCIGGIPKLGFCFSANLDTVDTINLALVAQGITSPGTTGLLFTAVYDITGTTSSTGTTFDFQKGCPSTSISGSPNVCVTIINGTTTPDQETVITASFNNNKPPPTVTLTASPTTLGPLNAGESAKSTITVTNTVSPGETVMLTVSPSSNALTATLNVGSVTGNGAVTLTVKVTVAGTYNVTVTGSYTVATSALSQSVTVNVVDFQIAANPTTIGPIIPGTSGTSTITITPLNGFSGTVTLTALPSTGLTASVSPNSVTGSSTATLTVNATALGTYTVKVKGTSNTVSHDTTTITVTVNIVHSVAIGSVASSTTSGTVGQKVKLTIIVQNKGNVQEVGTVEALVNGKIVSSQTVTLPVGNTTVNLTWDTASYSPGTYTIGAEVLLAPGETNTAGNVMMSASFTLTASPTLTSSPTSALSPTTLLAGGIAIIIAISTILVILRRKLGSRTPGPSPKRNKNK